MWKEMWPEMRGGVEPRHGHGRGSHQWLSSRRVAALLLAPALAVLLALLAFVPPAGAHPAQPAHGSHADPVGMDPPPRALLRAPPTGVTIQFSEDLNPATSRIVVVDPTNREVDDGDSQVSSTDARLLSVTLPLLPAGTYVVIWKAQSADDGHVTGGSYYFQIARPDGAAPPLPATLPTGNVPGGGGSSADSVTLDGPTLLQAIATWLALLFMTFWVGGVFWETWILPPDRGDLDPDLAAAAGVAARRFRRLAIPALGLLLLSNLVIVLAQSAQLAGDWSGLFAPNLLRAILFGSRYGLFWWGRELTALGALVLLVVAAQYNWPWTRPAASRPESAGSVGSGSAVTPQTIPDWRRELVATLRDIRSLPGQLAAGWRQRSGIGQLELALAVLLLMAFALSGHAAAVPVSIFFPAIAVDLLHLVGDAAWLGGLFYIGAVLVPALVALPLRRRARFLALGLPRFGAVAVLSAVMLAATGSLNATIRMSSFAQVFTTAYGRTLAIKIELFLVMAAISAYHAFWLRPRLAQALAASPATEAAPQTATEGALVTAGTTFAPGPASTTAGTHGGGGPARAERAKSHASPDQPLVLPLAERLEGWLRREAIIGVAVLLCVALLSAYAGSLVTTPAGPPASAGGAPFVSQPRQAGAYTVVLKVTPATFGPNTFEVALTDAAGKPVSDATVLVQTTMLDMDMGTQDVDLAPTPGAPGTYSGQGDLTMAGNWGLVVKVLPPGAKEYVSTSFKIIVGYGG